MSVTIGGEEGGINSNIVEYAAREMMKGKSIPKAAKFVAEKFNGSTNMFLGGAVNIDEGELQQALWNRLVQMTISNMKKMAAGKEHYAIDGTLQHFYGYKRTNKKMRAELKERVIDELGNDPFTHDDAP